MTFTGFGGDPGTPPPPLITMGDAGQSWGMGREQYGVEEEGGGWGGQPQISLETANHINGICWRKDLPLDQKKMQNQEGMCKKKWGKKQHSSLRVTDYHLKGWDTTFTAWLRLLKQPQRNSPACTHIKTTRSYQSWSHSSFPIESLPGRTNRQTSASICSWSTLSEREFPQKHRGGICHKPAKWR